jgi:hypothetical protein
MKTFENFGIFLLFGEEVLRQAPCFAKASDFVSINGIGATPDKTQGRMTRSFFDDGDFVWGQAVKFVKYLGIET